MTSTPCLDKSELRDDKPEDVRTFFDLDMDVFSEVVRTNIIGVVTMVRTFGRQMAEEGKGSILNFGSMNSYRPLSRVPAYALSKAAVVNLTQWLAAYLAGVGIRVNAVAPGFILNDRSIQYLGSEETGYTARGKSVLQHTPMHRFGQPTELLGCVEWLLNDEVSGFITGITVPVDGGFLSSAGI